MRLVEFTEPSEAFKSWFDGSQAVDGSGHPLKLYHGTSKDVDFKAFKMKPNGIWLATSSKEASMYASENDSQGAKWDSDIRNYVKTNTASRVIPVYVSAKNPKRYSELPDELKFANNYVKAQGVLFNKLRAEGYDSVCLANEVWVILSSPSQIKSAISAKTFDPKKPSMTESRLDELIQTRQYNDRPFFDVVKDFEKAGGSVSSGKYGTALIHPKWNYVLKVFSADPCYLRFVRWVMKNPTSGFPTFYGKVRKIVPFYKRGVAEKYLYVVKMERLFLIDLKTAEMIVSCVNDTNYKHFWEDIASPDFIAEFEKWKVLVAEITKSRQTNDFETTIKARREIRKAFFHERTFMIFQHFEQYPSLKEVCYANYLLTLAGLECAPDIHTGNFMKRANGEFVLIDPLWEGETFFQMLYKAENAECDYDPEPEDEKYTTIPGGKIRPIAKKPKALPFKNSAFTTDLDIPF